MTTQMVIQKDKYKKFKTYLEELDNNASLKNRPILRGDYLICRIEISADKKEVLLDAQADFL